jgi:AcrR family transcriptional regulator
MGTWQSTSAVRLTLLDVAARLLTEEGPAAVTVHRVANEVGTSTTAVYAHFASMEELRRAVRRDGFARLDKDLAVVQPTQDPVADLTLSGWVYARNGLQNPALPA